MAGEDRSRNGPGSSFGYWQDYQDMQQNGTQLTATEEERFNMNAPPGGDTVNWYYTPMLGWQYRGNQVDGTAGKSSYINDAGERVHYDSPAGWDQFTNTQMEHNRALNNALDIWSKGGDVYAQEGGRYSAENPYVESPEEAAERRARSAEYERTHVYDEATDTTWHGGGVGSGFSSKGKRKTIPITDEMRRQMNDPYARDYSGVSSFSKQGRDILNEAFNGRAFSPFGGIMGNSEAVDHLIEKFQDKDFNPLYARGGSKNKSDNNMMDYIYKEFGTNDQIANRRDVIERFEAYKKKMNLKDKHFMNTRMSQRLFDEMGLGDFKDFNADFAPNAGLPKENPFGETEGGGSFSSGRNESRNFRGLMSDDEGFGPNESKNVRGLMSDDSGFGPNINNMHSGGMGANPFAATKPAGDSYLETYLKRKNQSKPSVMSLMKELEDS